MPQKCQTREPQRPSTCQRLLPLLRLALITGADLYSLVHSPFWTDEIYLGGGATDE